MQQISGLAIRGDTPAVRGILLDLVGVVHVRDRLLPGSLDAISKIEAAGIRLKFITNTTRRPRRRIAESHANGTSSGVG
jgi:ribonucleotide monophosphatase NagD (HAD superfamily)